MISSINTMERKCKKKNSEWKNADYKVALIICSVIFSLYAISLLFPLLWIFVKSFTDAQEYIANPNALFPSVIYFGNYMEALFEVDNFDFITMIANTLILGIVIPTIQIAACCCISYAYAKFEFKLKPVIFFIAIVSMFVPSVGSLPIVFELMDNLNMLDSFGGYFLLTGGAMGFSFLLISSQYSSVSKEYTEAAEIDGASRLRIFIQIISPQILPTLVTLWILSFIGTWNDYAMQRIFLTSPEHKTLSVGIYDLYVYAAKTTGGAKYPVLFAGIAMVEIPVIILFFIFQKRILSFSLGGGIKG